MRAARWAGRLGPCRNRRTHPAATLDAVAKKHDVTVHQVGLAWLLHRSPAILVIPGSSDPAHVEDNVAAAALRLDQDDLVQLDSAVG